jgi:hypothetical protein
MPPGARLFLAGGLGVSAHRGSVREAFVESGLDRFSAKKLLNPMLLRLKAARLLPMNDAEIKDALASPPAVRAAGP